MSLVAIGAGGNGTITLPDATSTDWFTPPSGTGQSTPGRSERLTVKHLYGSTGTLTISAQVFHGVQQTIDGQTSITIAVSKARHFRADGTNWFLDDA